MYCRWNLIGIDPAIDHWVDGGGKDLFPREVTSSLSLTYLLIAEPHLTTRIPTDIHAAQEHALLPFHYGGRGRVVARRRVAMV